MEILAVNETYAATIFLTALLGFMFVVTVAVTFDKYKPRWERVLAAVASVLLFLAIFGIWTDPLYVTYDAIITDWNAVYEQGYEVVETNGKIVTLRKVDE